MMPSSLEEAAQHAQTPQPGQKLVLDTSRQVSNIPRGDLTQAPPHQDPQSKSTKWVYPSEQQLYNAMKRKGWSNVPEESIPMVLQIHNHINERTWAQIQDWEGAKDIELAQFQGRPKDMTPKAFFLSSVLRLYDAPFDRHDWYIKHSGRSEQQRYVIDYYYLPPSHPDHPPIPYVDARPALDHPRAFLLRGKRFLQDTLPGISGYLKKYQERRQE
jgi:cytochrome c heme-lyase